MSEKLPAVTAKEIARVAQQLGFVYRRQRGSHAIYVRLRDQARVVIPMHSKGDLKPKTLRGIIHDLKIPAEEFRKLLRPFPCAEFLKRTLTAWTDQHHLPPELVAYLPEHSQGVRKA